MRTKLCWSNPRTRPGILRHAIVLLYLLLACSMGAKAADKLTFEISFPASVHPQSITGRVFVIVSTEKNPEPRIQAGFWGDTAPIFGTDVAQLKPVETAIINSETLGYPPASLRDIPAGDYHVQALMNVYTQFHRSDGHAIWGHMDQWEGQQFNISPGNLYSEVQDVHLDPQAGYTIKLSLTKVIPPITMPADTAWLKHIKIQSALLSKFWGRPFYLGATVLLPQGYDAHPDAHYPVLYLQDHFSLGPPIPFTDPNAPGGSKGRWAARGVEMYQAWTSDHFPRMIAVRFQHPTPYFDDSYAINSANNGPYGDAIMTELIPYLEEHFRIIRQPYARVLAGGSTGGWESLALQVYHPEFFGGTWTFFPDPIDFRRYQLTDIYQDENAFYEPGHHWLQAPRYMARKADGQPEVSSRDFSRLEAVLGSHGRSGQQLEIWEAAYGPVGDDGYPQPLWDKLTGTIDHSVAEYMRDHGYDLRYYTEKNWPKIGPQLAGKIYLYCGDMDNYYLNLAVYLFEDFLIKTKDPYYAGSVEYGRPMKGHGWMPMSFPELIKMMAEHIDKTAPAREDTGGWHY
ncbi:MAG TPA: alpha/beta hydrolase-fold protein [Terriglobia bacterium]|nr:alpha/beta hydrolase-fold protein [Terriglobia bacterium]